MNRFEQLQQSQRGSSFVSLLLVLVILAALYFGYFGLPQIGSERSKGKTAIDSSRAVACRVQRQQIERDIEMWKVSHPDEQPTLASLRASGLRVPSCPEGGRYDIVEGSVHCSIHP